MPVKNLVRASLLPVLSFAQPDTGLARPRLTPVWTDQAVIQRDKPIRIEGRAGPGEVLVAELDGTERIGRADETGRFVLQWPAHPASERGLTLTVRGEDGAAVVIRDLLIGDVYLCAGQSNMEMQVIYALDGWNRTHAATDPLLRLLAVPRGAAYRPAEVFSSAAAWQVAAPTTVAPFSAACHAMAAELRRRWGIPIGAIAAAWGGTTIEPWTLLDASGQVSQTPSSGQTPTAPGVLAHGMLAPLGGTSLAGIVWYQGESDVGRAGYGTRLAAAIAGWRAQFGAHTPVYVVQLTGYGAPQVVPGPSSGALLREEQRRAILANAPGQLVTAVDLGERDDIHPANKVELGRRLALAAAGQTLPQPLWARREDGVVRIGFSGVAGGWQSWGGPPLGFELCVAPDQGCRLVAARIEGDTIVLANVNAGAGLVRYAWADYPTVNLYDARRVPPPSFAMSVSQ